MRRIHKFHKKHKTSIAAFIWKLAIFLATAAAAVYITVEFEVWGHDLKNYYFLTGRYTDLLFFAGMMLIIGYVLKKLVVIAWKMEFK